VARWPLSLLENEQVRRQPDHIVEVVRHGSMNVERSTKRIDFVLKMAAHRAIDGGERLVQKQDGRLRQRTG
jgi:hypothetical protein